MKYVLSLWTSLWLLGAAQAQSPQYFTDKYSFPLSAPWRFTGNMGEIRPNHFHGGLDIAGTERTPVYAIYDGYVSRAKASTYGYGNVLYITHPETGHVSVYAHLSRFHGAAKTYIRQKQYEQERFEVELFPNPDEIPIKKGEIIGYVGNTGGSFGPHLHFEIRTFNDLVLNPLRFFPTVFKDSQPPVLTRLALVPQTAEARVQGQYKTGFYTLLKNTEGYTLREPVTAYGQIGLELASHDIADGSPNIFATAQMVARVNGEEIYRHEIEAYPMDEARALNLHINYATLKRTRIAMQRLYETEGNYLGIYKSLRRGYIEVKEGERYEIEIECSDAKGNSSRLRFSIVGKKPTTAVFAASPAPIKAQIQVEYEPAALLIKAAGLQKGGEAATVFVAGLPQNLPLAYMAGQQAHYVWDLRRGFPDSLRVGGLSQRLPKHQRILSHRDFSFQGSFLELFFPKGALPDTAFLRVEAQGRTLHIGHSEIPLTQEIQVCYLYSKAGVRLANPEKLGVSIAGKPFTKVKATGEMLCFSTKLLGTFQLVEDTTPPSIRLLAKTPSRVNIAVSDNLSGVAAFKATLNGEFILMLYESKANLLWTDPDYGKPLKGTLRLWVRDEVGNSQEASWQL
jgi:hypothetical protein